MGEGTFANSLHSTFGASDNIDDIRGLTIDAAFDVVKGPIFKGMLFTVFLHERMQWADRVSALECAMFNFKVFPDTCPDKSTFDVGGHPVTGFLG